MQGSNPKHSMYPMGTGVMYHVSPRKNREQIMSEGLQGQERHNLTDSPWDYRVDQPAGNYLFDNPEDAKGYAYTLRGQQANDNWTKEPDWEEQYTHDYPEGFHDWDWEDQDNWHDNNEPVQRKDDHNGYDIYAVNAHGLPLAPDPESRLHHGPEDLGSLYEHYQKARKDMDWTDQEPHPEELHNEVGQYYGDEPRRYYVPAGITPDRLQLHEHMPSWDMSMGGYYDHIENEGDQSVPSAWMQTPMTEWPQPGHDPRLGKLTRQSMPAVLYHSAPAAARQQIMQQGILPKQELQPHQPFYYPGDEHVWTFNDPDTAAWWAKGDRGGNNDVWRIDAQALPQSAIDYGAAKDHGTFLHGRVPPGAIELHYPAENLPSTQPAWATTSTREFSPLSYTGEENSTQLDVKHAAAMHPKHHTTAQDHERGKQRYGLPKPHKKRKVILFPKRRKGAVDPQWLRQWIETNGPWLYHSCNQDVRAKILKEGLVPHDHGPGSKYIDALVPRDNSVYIRAIPHSFHLNPESSIHQGRVAIDLRKLDPSRIQADEDAWSEPVDHRKIGIPRTVDRRGPGGGLILKDIEGNQFPHWGAWADHWQLSQPGQTAHSLNSLKTASVYGGIDPSALRASEDVPNEERPGYHLGTPMVTPVPIEPEPVAAAPAYPRRKVPCQHCQGKGEVTEQYDQWEEPWQRPCPECQGDGYLVNALTASLGGAWYVNHDIPAERVSLHTPALQPQNPDLQPTTGEVQPLQSLQPVQPVRPSSHAHNTHSLTPPNPHPAELLLGPDHYHQAGLSLSPSLPPHPPFRDSLYSSGVCNDLSPGQVETILPHPPLSENQAACDRVDTRNPYMRSRQASDDSEGRAQSYAYSAWAHDGQGREQAYPWLEHSDQHAGSSSASSGVEVGNAWSEVGMLGQKASMSEDLKGIPYEQMFDRGTLNRTQSFSDGTRNTAQSFSMGPLWMEHAAGDSFGSPFEDSPYELDPKTAGKLHDFLMNPKSRPDMQTPEGQAFLSTLNDRYWNEKTDPLMPWLAREWKKGRIYHRPDTNNIGFADYDFPQSLTPERLNHWADFYGSNHPLRQQLGDIMKSQVNIPATWKHHHTGEIYQGPRDHPNDERLPDPDVGHFPTMVNEWDEAMKQEAHEQALANGEVVHQYPDGWSLQQLKDEAALKAEGEAMGHCVGGYGDAVRSGRSMIYSLRDPKGSPHVTMEMHPTQHEFDPDRFQDDEWWKAIPQRLQQSVIEHHHGLPYTYPDYPPEKVEETLNAWKEKYPGNPKPENASIVQIQGKGNEMPDPKYQAYLKQYFQSFPEETRPNWESSGLDEVSRLHHLGLTHSFRKARDDYYDEGGYGEHGDYGLADNRPIDWQSLFEDNLRYSGHGYGNHWESANVKPMWEYAKQRGDTAGFAKGAEGFEQGQQESFDNWMDQNHEYAPRYVDEPHGWADEDGVETDEGEGKPYWIPNPADPEKYFDPTEAEDEYDRAMTNWYEDHAGMQGASQLYGVINDQMDYHPETGYTLKPQPYTFSSWGLESEELYSPYWKIAEFLSQSPRPARPAWLAEGR